MPDEACPEPAPDWARVEGDLRWCLIEGRGADGRDVMFEALQMKDGARARAALHNGFMMCRRDEDSTANFLACERSDPARLRIVARGVIGLPPLS